MNKVFQAFPDQLSSEIFHSYYFCSIKNTDIDNSGIVIDDGLFELKFLKEKNVYVLVGDHKFLLPRTVLLGKVGVPSKLVFPGEINYFTIKIQAWAAWLFHLDPYEPISDISKRLFPNIYQLYEKIFDTDNFKEQVQAVEQFFLQHPLPQLQGHEMTKEICQRIYETSGNIKIKELIAPFPHSRQKINNLFFYQTKNSIKEFAVLTRLRAIMAHYMDHPEKSLTEICYAYGYFDQSHFVKDMRRMTGVTALKFSKMENVFYEQLKNKG